MLEEQLGIKVKDEEIILAELKKNLLFSQSHNVDFKVKFALLLIGKVLVPSKACQLSRTLIPFLHEVELLNQMNWAKYVLDELVAGIRRSKMNKAISVDGCVLFLMARTRLNENYSCMKHHNSIRWNTNMIFFITMCRCSI